MPEGQRIAESNGDSGLEMKNNGRISNGISPPRSLQLKIPSRGGDSPVDDENSLLGGFQLGGSPSSTSGSSRPITPILKPSLGPRKSSLAGAGNNGTSGDQRRAAFQRPRTSVRFSITSPTESPKTPTFTLGSPTSKKSFSESFFKSFNESVDHSDDDEDDHGRFSPPHRLLRRDSITIKVKPGQAFSTHADLKVGQLSEADPKLGTLGELRHYVQTGTKMKVKKFLRSNDWSENHRIRSELWKELCRDRDHAGRLTVYNETVAEMTDDRVPWRPSVLKAGQNVVFCDHQLTLKGREAVLRLLTVLEHLRPDYTYVPILHPLAALFLHYMEEPDAYSCLVHLLVERQGLFLLQSDIAIAASRRTVLLLVKKYKSHVYNLLRKMLPSSVGNNDDELMTLFDDWKSWLFKDLPFKHVVRLTDCFLYEGQKVLFRVILSLLHHWYRWHKSRPSKFKDGQWALAVVREEIQTFCENINCTPDKLLKVAFGIRNLKTSSISRVQEDCELQRRRGLGELGRQASEFNFQRTMSQHNPFIDYLLHNCDFLEPAVASDIGHWLPQRMTLLHPRLLFTVQQHGTSFVRLWQNIEQYDSTIFIIKTQDNQIFGAYASQPWAERNNRTRVASSYFGTGESWVFRVVKEVPEVFWWVGKDSEGTKVKHDQELFLAAGNDWLKIGGGGGDALCITGSLESGYTERCTTFNNPPLTATRDFDIDELQVYGFTDGHDE